MIATGNVLYFCLSIHLEVININADLVMHNNYVLIDTVDNKRTHILLSFLFSADDKKDCKIYPECKELFCHLLRKMRI